MSKPAFPGVLASTSLTSGIVACWPLNEGSGAVATDIVGAAQLDTSGSGVSWNASPLGLLTVGSPSRATVATPSYLKLPISPGVTLFWTGAVLGSLGSLGGFCGVAESTGPTNDYDMNSSSGKVCVGVNNAGSNGGFVGSTSITSTTYTLTARFGNTQDGAPINAWTSLVLNGTLDTLDSTSIISSISYGGTSVVFLGTFPGQSDATNIRHDLLVIWNRLILASEATAMNADPYQIFVGPFVQNPAALLPAM